MEYESVQPLLQWVQAHPHWAGFVVFLISLSESLAIVGLVVPGVVLMTAIGAMMGAGVLPFWGTLIWAILGAIAGDGISYWLGYHYHEHLKDFWPFRQFPGLLKRGEEFFKHHGGKSIIFGRFVGPVRPMIPVIAGMMDMTPRRFLVFNILSAIVWAPLYSLPGILIGASLGTLSPEVARHIMVLILFLLLALWIIYMLLLKFGLWVGGSISRFLSKIWKRWQRSNQLPWLHKMLATAQGTEEGQLGAALLSLISAFIFIFISLSVYYSEELNLLNEPIYQALRPLYSDRWVDLAVYITGFGQPSVLLPAAAAVGIWFFLKKQYIAMFCWLGTIAVGETIGFGIRPIIEMPRPEGLMQLTTEYSYPSGHSLTATLVYGLAAAFIQQTVEQKHRWIAWAVSIPLILLISFSRLYLGVHWFTDVLGGIALGTACVALGILIFRRLEDQPPSVKDILLPGLVVLALTLSYYCIKSYPKIRKNVVRQWPVRLLNNQDWWNDNTDQYELYRTGAIKRFATYFDLQWLGTLDKIKSTLKEAGWKTLPAFGVQSSLNMLSSNPDSNSMPVLPKFHRDRLPVVVASKKLDDKHRLVLELWNSDFVTQDKTPLWVGTLRLEELVHPIPLVSFYQENEAHKSRIEDLIADLKKTPDTAFRIHPATVANIEQILFIKSGRSAYSDKWLDKSSDNKTENKTGNKTDNKPGN